MKTKVTDESKPNDSPLYYITQLAGKLPQPRHGPPFRAPVTLIGSIGMMEMREEWEGEET